MTRQKKTLIRIIISAAVFAGAFFIRMLNGTAGITAFCAVLVIAGYDVIFAFLEEDEHRAPVPPWALKVILEEEA